jgi:hypothetical protein
LGDGSLRLRSAAILLSTILSSCWALSRALRLMGWPWWGGATPPAPPPDPE